MDQTIVPDITPETECGSHELLERSQGKLYQCFAVKMCPSKVMIRRKTVAEIDQSEPSKGETIIVVLWI